MTDITNAVTAGARRILFKRGDVFTAPTLGYFTTQGPGLIGAYGSGAAPVICSHYSCSAGAGASFTGTLNGTTLTVSAVTGTILVGQTLESVAGNTASTNRNGCAINIVGGAGTTWTVTNCGQAAVGPEAMWTGLDNSLFNFGHYDHPTVNNCSYAPNCTAGQLADWRLMDLKFVGNNSGEAMGTGGQGQFDYVTQLRLGACPGFRWNSSEGPCLNAGNGYATVA